MYAVIFTAEINELDASYTKTAKKMKNLAINEYGCINFNSVTEGNLEVSISYWQTMEDIKRWKQDKEHLKAQALGKSKWYENFNIDIVEVIKQREFTI